MSNKKDYIKTLETTIDKYKNKISKIDTFLENYKSDNKEHLLAERDNLKEKFAQGEKMLQKIQASSEDTYESIKEASSEIFESVKEAFQEFSHLITMEQLVRAKDEIVEYGHEKADELQDYIKNRPLATAAWAMGIGLFVGILLSRSK